MTTSQLFTSLTLLLASAATLGAQQPSMPAKTTAVLVILTAKPGIDRAEIAKILPDEVRATVRLYLDGKILNWYSRADGRGVVFLMNCKDAREAHDMLAQLPLGKADLMDYQITPLAPLAPLGLLASQPK